MSADDHAGAVLDVQAFAIPGDAVDNTGPDSRIELYDRCGFGQAKAVVGLARSSSITIHFKPSSWLFRLSIMERLDSDRGLRRVLRPMVVGGLTVGAPAATGQRAVLRAALQYAEFDLPVFPVYLAAGRQTVARFLGTNGGNRKTGRTHQ